MKKLLLVTILALSSITLYAQEPCEVGNTQSICLRNHHIELPSYSLKCLIRSSSAAVFNYINCTTSTIERSHSFQSFSIACDQGPFIPSPDETRTIQFNIDKQNSLSTLDVIIEEQNYGETSIVGRLEELPLINSKIGFKLGFGEELALTLECRNY